MRQMQNCRNESIIKKKQIKTKGKIELDEDFLIKIIKRLKGISRRLDNESRKNNNGMVSATCCGPYSVGRYLELKMIQSIGLDHSILPLSISYQEAKESFCPLMIGASRRPTTKDAGQSRSRRDEGKRKSCRQT